ncbi:MAG: accessory gene regulator B family protein [Defluviitaleaceae bacterium]|nr:accessory gene regulator B family protein [Defluviitaleaceae bacterium]
MTATMTHRAAVVVAHKINQHMTTPKEGVAFKKIVLGVEILFINISKLTILVALAAILGVLPQTILALIGFNALRCTAAGVHAESKYGCIITSTILMVIVPFFTWGIYIPRSATVIIFALIFIAMWKYAPMDTKSRPLLGQKKREMLKLVSMVTSVVIAAFLIVSPFQEANFMVILGAVYATVAILPATYKLLNREVNNYEKYEHNKQNS